MFKRNLFLFILFSSFLISAQNQKRNGKQIKHIVISSSKAQSLGLPVITKPPPITSSGQNNKNTRGNRNRKSSLGGLSNTNNNYRMSKTDRLYFA
jgi:hypothetical protein